MALEGIFLGFATEADAVLVEAMTSGVVGALAYVRAPLRAMLALYVLMHGFRMVAGEGSAREFTSAVMRAVCVITLLQATYYIPWVQQYLFVTLPNELASALNGPRVTVNTAQVFDALWSASLNSAAPILKKASGFFNGINYLVIWLFIFVGLGGILIMFAIWYMSKVTIAILLIMGAFLIVFYLFKGTRGITTGWVGKLVGVLTWQLATLIVVRLVMVAIHARMLAFNANPGASIDEMTGAFAGITALFWLGAIFVAVIPTAVAIGGGVGAAHVGSVAMAASVVGRAASIVSRK